MFPPQDKAGETSVLFGGFQIGKAAGIPLKLHWTMVLFVPWLASEINAGMQYTSPAWGWLAVIALFASVALHELGHAFAARGRGFPVRDIVLTPIGGVAFLSRAPRRSQDEMVIAIAGPIVSLALALAFGGVFAAFATRAPRDFVETTLLLSGINMSLVLFNLIPCFPMDGGRMFRAWQTKRVGRLEATRRAVQLGKWIAILFAIYGAFTGRWTLIIIAFVVYTAAAAEYRQVLLQERPPPPPFFGPFGPLGGFAPPRPQPPAEVIDVEVSPPPYRRGDGP